MLRERQAILGVGAWDPKRGRVKERKGHGVGDTPEGLEGDDAAVLPADALEKLLVLDAWVAPLVESAAYVRHSTA